MINRTLAWLDRRNFVSVRSFTLYATVWMTWAVTTQAWQFAMASKFDGMATAAIIAALTAPVTLLQGYVFKSYTESTK